MTITMRGDSGLAVLAVYDFCEEHELGYVLDFLNLHDTFSEEELKQAILRVKIGVSSFYPVLNHSVK